MDLYKAVVEKLSDADLAKDWNARSVALTLANSFAPPAVKEDRVKMNISNSVSESLY